MYIIIFQNKMFLLPRLPNLFFSARNRKQTIFFCLAPGTRVIDLPEL